jgi:hypothetical protein
MKAFIACAAAACFAAPAFAAGPHPHSAGDAFVAHITSTGVATDAGPFAHVAGQGTIYSDSATGAPQQQVIALLPLSPTPTLYLNLGASKASAANAGIGVDSESWGANAEVDSVQASINLNPLPPAGPFPQPFLNITADKVKADAGLSIVFPSSDTVSSGAKIGHLKISGSALGAATVHYSGSPAVNTVIYNSPTVTITLNKRELSGVITCPPCMFTPHLIETDAVDIELHQAPWRGNKYSGHIVIGRTSAGQ